MATTLKFYHGILAICFVLLLIPTNSQAVVISGDPNANGPYVDTIEFHVMSSSDTRNALLNDSIDIIGDMIGRDYLDTLEDSNVDIEDTFYNGYGTVYIRTNRYPLNVTALRRAFAYSFNKTYISEEYYNGTVTPIDSVQPLSNPFNIDSEYTDTYYDLDNDTGAILLAQAGFSDIDDDGDLDAPNGTAFQVVVDCLDSGANQEIGIESVAALTRLKINATVNIVDIGTWLDKIANTGDYDMIVLAKTGFTSDPTWMADRYSSNMANSVSMNPTGFANSTFDSWIQQLKYGTTWTEVKEAATAMQEILHYECPEVPIYNGYAYYAQRNDTYQNFVNELLYGTPSYWTSMKARLQTDEGGALGGTLRVGTKDNHSTFNFMEEVSTTQRIELIDDLLWDTLLKETPEKEMIPWIAEDWDIRTNESDPSIDDGHVVYTFYLVKNASFTDGHPLTADDVAFSLWFYANESSNPYEQNLVNMLRADAISSYILQVEFSTSTFWNLYHTGLSPIMPEHIMSAYAPNEYLLWNPDPNTEEMVTSGPFNVSQYHIGSNYTLERVPTHWKHLPQRDDSQAPIVDDTADFTIGWGTPSVSIFWDANDAYPYSYRILKNGTVQESGLWDGSFIQYNIAETLELGVHNYTIEFKDWGGRTSTDMVLITVVDHQDPIIDTFGNSAYQYMTTGHWLNFTCYDDHPDSYEFYANDALIDSWDWTGEDLGFNIDGYAIGVWNFTLLLNDTSGNMASESAFITVYESANPLNEAPDSYVYQYGTEGHWLNWTLFDVAPDSYEFYVNDELESSGDWTGENLNFPVDGYGLGIWEFTLFVNDTSGNSAQSTAFVIVEDAEDPVLNDPEDIQYVEGSTDNWIHWQVNDVLPDSYVLYRNGTPVASGSWSNGFLNISIDNLDPGVYRYRLVVSDTSGNTAESTVLVTVAPAIVPPPLSIILIGSGIGIVCIVIVIIALRRK
ncbi:MAG: exported protein of unknown function [Candidatus Thorarchaeota archaeon]|nr:MAG: exported protein of unknown function [Candidatus Thorarchaeota archaeon]